MDEQRKLGVGWWQASDGRWYPPDLHPEAGWREYFASLTSASEPGGATTAEQPAPWAAPVEGSTRVKRGLRPRLWWLPVGTWGLTAVGLLMAGALGSDGDRQTVDVADGPTTTRPVAPTSRPGPAPDNVPRPTIPPVPPTTALPTTTTAAPTTTTAAPTTTAVPPTTAAPSTTAAPTTTPTTTAAPPPAPARASGAGGLCDPNYEPCVAPASDVDCLGSGGNGPAYAAGPVRVVGSDIYDLDQDGNGIGCE